MFKDLKRPIAFFDLETTGTNVGRDRIVEIAVLKIFPDGNRESRTWIVNPTIPIPEHVSKIHGFYDKDVADKPPFREIARTVYSFIEGCDLAGYNSNLFDIPLLAEEFIRAGVEIDFQKRNFIDVQVIFHKMEQRTLSAAYQFYCGKELKGAHSALTDAEATFEVLMSQLEKYNDLPKEIEALAKFSTYNRFADFAGRILMNAKGEEVFNFGKFKGEKVVDVLEKEPGYFNWMMEGDFPEYTKKILTEIRLRKLKEKFGPG
jgi:DNA polymerase III subunit epsilon